MTSATLTGIQPGALAPADQERKEHLGKALGRIASGVYIVTLTAEGERHGIMATWIAQAGFNPPAITLAFNKERPILSHITPDARLTVNVLSGKNMDIFKSFAAPAKEGVDRFDGLELAQDTGASGPVFARAVSYLDCQVKTLVDAGDHVVVLAEASGGQLLNEEEQPMTHLRKNGFGY